MRLVTFRTNDGARLGVVRNGDEVVEVDDPRDMLSLIDAGAEGLRKVEQALSSSRSKAHRLDSVHLLPPLPEPR